MAVPKKRVSRTRKNLRHTNWKKEVIPQALKALSLAKSSRTTRGNFKLSQLTGLRAAPATPEDANRENQSNPGQSPDAE